MIDFKKLCKVTAWHNNCGLNCITHFLCSKLESGELQSLFSEQPEYQALLHAFQEYYHLSQQPSWEHIKTLFESYLVPTDREAILAPVLRLYLGKMVAQNAQNHWETTGSLAISEYLENGLCTDIAELVMRQNKDWLNQMRTKFQTQLEEIQKQEIPEIDLFHKKNALLDIFLEEAKHYWLETGCTLYADQLADMNKSETISSELLVLLTQKLDIHLMIYVQDAKTKKYDTFTLSDQKCTWTLKVLNNGIHWEYEGTDQEKTQQHNHYYPETFYDDEFYHKNTLSGVFKTFGNHGYGTEKNIIERIKNDFENIIFSPHRTQAEGALNNMLDNTASLESLNQISGEEQTEMFESYFNQLQDVFNTKTNTNTNEISELCTPMYYEDLISVKRKSDEVKNEYDEYAEKEKESHKKFKNA